MARVAPDKSYSWLERWDSTKPPSPKYREGINNFLLALEEMTREDRQRIKQLYTDWWNSIVFKASGQMLAAGTLMNLHSDLTKALAIHFEGRLTIDNSFRNPTGNHELRHIALAFCKPPQEIVLRHNQRNDLRLLERVSNRGWILSPFEIVAKAQRLLHSGLEASIYSDIAAALVVLTGRRVSEILVTAKFSRCTAYSVWFTGQLKTRGKELPAVEIPTLIEAERIIHGVSRLRELFLVDDTNRDLLDSYKNDVRCQVIRTFCDLVPTIQMVEGEMRPTTHRMRAVYNCLATFFYAPPGLKDDLYTKVIMAHEDRNSTLNYMVYQIADEVIAASGGKRQGILLDRPGVEVLQVFRTSMENRQLRSTSFVDGAVVTSSSTQNSLVTEASAVAGTDRIPETSNTHPISVAASTATESTSEVYVLCEASSSTQIDRIAEVPVLPQADGATTTSIVSSILGDCTGGDCLDDDPGPVVEGIAVDSNPIDSEQASSAIAVQWTGVNEAAYRAVCLRLLKSPIFGALAVGLIASTGRSIGELIKSGIFLSDERDDTLVFKTQMSRTCWLIPTLAKSRLIMQAIERLRAHGWTKQKHLRYMAPNQIKSVCQPVVQPFIAKEFSQIIEDASYSGLIAAYCTLTGSPQAINTPAKEILTDVVPSSSSKVVSSPPNGVSGGEITSVNHPEQHPATVRPTEAELHLTLRGEALLLYQAIASQLGLAVEDALPAILRLARRSLPSVEQMSIAAAESRSQMPSSVVEADSAGEEFRSIEEASDSFLEAPSTYQLAAKVAQLELQLQQVTALIANLNFHPDPPDEPSSSKLANSQLATQRKSQKQEKASPRSNKEIESNLKGRAIQKIDRTVRSVMQFNEQAKEQEQKWFISESLIFRLTGCNRPAVRRYFEALRSAIDEHNQLHQLSERHNQLKAKSSGEQALQNAVDRAISLSPFPLN